MPGGAGLCALLVAWLGCGESGDFSGSPADSLPPHIQQLTDWSARPGWSHDGRRLLLLIWTGDTEYAARQPRLVRRRQLLTGSGASATAFLETQNFRPPDDEADGVFPDGRHTTVERNPRNFLLPGMVEIWKLVLDGSGS